MPTSVPSRHLLLVVRHAEADASGASDAERKLTAQGRVDAEQTGEWLAGKAVRAHAALVSSATRARQTWENLATAAEWDAAPTVEPALYDSDVDTVLDLVAQVDESARTLVVVGHNPTMASLAMLLDDGDGDPMASLEMTRGFPPCGVAAFSLDAPWSEAAPGLGTLRAFHAPRPGR